MQRVDGAVMRSSWPTTTTTTSCRAAIISGVNPVLTCIREFAPRSFLLIHGEKARSRYSVNALMMLRRSRKKIMIIPGANQLAA